MKSATNSNSSFSGPEDLEPRLRSPGREKNSASLLKGISHARLSNPSYLKDTHSGRPEAVVKVVSQARGFRAKKLMEYISRIDEKDKENIEVEDAQGVAHKGRGDVQNIYEVWQKDFERMKPGLKIKPRHVTHLMLSGSCKSNKKNNIKVLAAAKAVISDQVGAKGYDYICALHEDSGHSHVHFAIKNSHRSPGGPKLRLNPTELYKIRKAFAAEMTDLGLDHVATFRLDRPDVISRVARGIETLKKKETQYQRALKRSAPSFDAFSYRNEVSKTICRLREQVKKETKRKSEKRLNLLGSLRKLERKLNKGRVEIAVEVKATIERFEKETSKYRQSLAMLKNPDFSKLKFSKDERAKQEKKLKHMDISIRESIKVSRKHIKDSDLPEDKKKESLAMLKTHEKAISKSLSISEIYTDKQIERLLNGIDSDFKKLSDDKINVEEKAKLKKKLKRDVSLARRVVKYSASLPGERKTILKDLRFYKNQVSRSIFKGR